jgi:hypothetical protein
MFRDFQMHDRTETWLRRTYQSSSDHNLSKVPMTQVIICDSGSVLTQIENGSGKSRVNLPTSFLPLEKMWLVKSAVACSS